MQRRRDTHKGASREQRIAANSSQTASGKVSQ